MKVFMVPSPVMLVIAWVGQAASKFVDLYTPYVVPLALIQDSWGLPRVGVIPDMTGG